MKSCQSRIYGAEFSQEEIREAVQNGRLLSMELEFNRSCNFRCIYCYAANNSFYENELTKEEFHDVIVQARDLGAKKIIVLGGEPMLYPHILEMIRFIKKQGMEIELFTNGARITPSTAQVLKDNNVRVVLKMNTFDENLQNKLSGKKDAYTQIQEAFKNLKQAGYPSEDGRLGVSTIICKQNFDELAQMWEWLRDQDIVPYFEMITPQGKARESEYLVVEPDKIEDLFCRIAKLDWEKYGYQWDPKPPLVGGECLRHQFSCAVSSQGDVQPCVGVTVTVGNMRERKLKDIITDSEIIQDLKNYQQTIKGPCGECAQLSECYGCRGAAYQLTGDYLASDPLCWKNAQKQDDIVSLPVEASRLVPHKPPMLMLDRLLTVGERASLSEVTVSEDSIFLEEKGMIDEAGYPEIMSQAVAAQEGFKNLEKTDQPEGYLLGVKNMEILGTAGPGDRLVVSVYKVAKYGDFGIVRGEIFKDKEVIARGELKVWQGETAAGE